MSQSEMLYDKRLVHRLIKGGVLTQNQYEAYLNNLPDVAGKSEPLVPEDADAVDSQPQEEGDQTEAV